MKRTLATAGLALALAAAVQASHADPVTDWNRRAGELMIEARLGTPAAIRVSAIVQTAVYDALAGAPASSDTISAAHAAVAAVAAANRVALARLLPAADASLARAYQAALAPIPEGAAKAAGIEAGERAALAVLARRADDGAALAESYRPRTSPGAYVPTSAVAVPHWPGRKPWLLERADQLRPAPPPALDSARWARDLNEVKTVGSRSATARGADQTEMARFWEYSLPPIYYEVVRSAVERKPRPPLETARLYAAVAQGMDDALIAVMDAKYHYNFWRPQTAIRNADMDGRPDTERDPQWTSFIDAPLHPEYPSAHAILAGVVGTVVQADAGPGPVALATTSPTAKGVTRRWNSTGAFMQEVAEARVYEGIHYRFSVETGLAMGSRIGALAAARILEPRH